ncbi:sensor histidine kinase YvcQ [Alicyclobacillus acidoterrestris]|nr:hypothetical protein N007_13090 [Alicyclobacillus acidoterrestris ATCC 49025]GEO26669.1 sensor histidine kinase YvcQ [Alicyclobacillus acidoterrestris]
MTTGGEGRMRISPIRIYARDIWVPVMCVVLGLVVGIGTVWLAGVSRGHHQRASVSDALYGFLLALFISIMGFAFHYLRRRRLLSVVTRQLVQSNLPLDAADSLRRYATTAEHLYITQLLESYLAAYREDLQQAESKRRFYEHFTTRFAHQMKTPLTVLRLLTKELLADAVQRDTEPAQALSPTIDEMQAELTKLETALDTMLYTARLQSFSFDVRMVRLPLAPLLRQVINEHKTSWIRQKIYPRLDVPGHLEVTSDEKWLRFICDQIVRNALQYGYKVDTSGRATNEPATFVIAATEDDEWIRVTFCDEGIGMHPRDLRRMFEPFYTGENGRTHSRATGMGLYLAAEAAQRLGITLSAESVLHEGTTVSVVIPKSSFIAPYVESSREVTKL